MTGREERSEHKYSLILPVVWFSTVGVRALVFAAFRIDGTMRCRWSSVGFSQRDEERICDGVRLARDLFAVLMCCGVRPPSLGSVHLAWLLPDQAHS